MGANAAIRQSFFTALTETSATDKEGVGTIRRTQNGDTYKWVQNKHSAALTVGQTAFHSLANQATFNTLVYDCAAADLGCMAGIVMATSLAVDYFGWIQIFGYNASVAVLAYQVGPVVSGSWLKGTDSLATLTYGVALGTAPIYTRGVIALEGLASTVTVATATKCFIQCL